MVSSAELISLIKKFNVADRLVIVEEVLKDIRKESLSKVGSKSLDESNWEPAILSLAGIFDEEEASVFMRAIEESRKIDNDEW